jgi:hypothetical protein
MSFEEMTREAEGVPAGSDGLVELGATYEPDADAKDAYDEAYSLYRAAYAALEPVFDRREDAVG